MSSRFRWRFSRDRERWLLALDRWRYPDRDHLNVVLIEVGDGDGWIWFEVLDSGAGIIHMVVAPEVRGRWFGRDGNTRIRLAAEFMGLERVYYLDNGYNEKVGEYVKRLGWHKFDHGYYLEIYDGR